MAKAEQGNVVQAIFFWIVSVAGGIHQPFIFHKIDLIVSNPGSCQGHVPRSTGSKITRVAGRGLALAIILYFKNFEGG